MASAKKSNAQAAAKRVSAKTASRAGSVEEGPADRVTRGGDASAHSAHAGQPADSSVAHAPASGTRSAEGGYPSGEYDVVAPKPAAAVSKSAQEDAVLTAHLDAATNLDAVLDTVKRECHLSADKLQKATEALPIGTVIEHVGASRWRVHVLGQNRYGFGASHTKAVESYVMGDDGGNEESAAVERLKAMPAKERESIIERDRKAAARTGGTDPLAFGREEALKVAKADKDAKPAARSAGSDGAEKASARDEAGKK